MKTINITLYERTYQGTNNTDDQDEMTIYDTIEVSSNVLPYIDELINDIESDPHVELIIIQLNNNGVYQESIETDKSQLMKLIKKTAWSTV